MKNFKKIMSIMLVAILSLTIMSCGGNSAEPATNTTKGEQKETQEKNDVISTSEKEEDNVASFTKAEDIEAPAGKVLRSLPLDEVSETPIRIASICVQNNPWGAAVVVGQQFAKEILADRNCVVDVISVESFDAMKWVSAIDNCVASGYDAICFFGVSDELMGSVQSATDAGIKTFTFNGDLPDSDRVAWYGMDDYAAGKTAGQAVADALPDGGTYAIITGDFSVYGHEMRRTGFHSVVDEIDSFEMVGEYQNDDDADKAYSYTTDILTANPDIDAIYVTAGGPAGAAQAIEDAGKSGEVMLVCHDVLDSVADYIKDGTISLAIDQDPFNQGYQPVVDAYNYLVGDVKPEEKNAYEAILATPDTVEDLFPELF